MMQDDSDLIVADVREESEYCGVLGHVSGACSYPCNSSVRQNTYTDDLRVVNLDKKILK